VTSPRARPRNQRVSSTSGSQPHHDGGSGLVRLQSQQIANRQDRRIVGAEQLMPQKRTIRPPRDAIGKRAANVDPKMPARLHSTILVAELARVQGRRNSDGPRNYDFFPPIDISFVCVRKKSAPLATAGVA
jgi:hypothetical protein